MEKKINYFKTAAQLALLGVVLLSCNRPPAQESMPQKTENTEQASSKNKEVSKEALITFKSRISDLRSQLKQIRAETLSEANVSQAISAYESLDQENSLFRERDRKVFEALKSIGVLRFQVGTGEIGALQNALIDTGSLQLNSNDPAIYGTKTNDALISYFKELETKIRPSNQTRVSTSEDIAQTPTVTDEAQETPEINARAKETTKMPFNDLIPSLLGVMLLGVLGSLVYWVWNLSQKLTILEKSLSIKGKGTHQQLKKQENDISNIATNIRELGQKIATQEQRIKSIEYSAKTSAIPNSSSIQNFGPPTMQAALEDPRESQRQKAQVLSNPSSYRSKESASRSSQIAKQYNQSPQQFAGSAIGVSQTKDSLNLNLRDSSRTSVVLAKDPSPNYWIIQDESGNLWLFPRQGWEPSIGTIESFGRLFRSTGEVSRQFQVIRPAAVIATSQSEWSLQEIGEIEFK